MQILHSDLQITDITQSLLFSYLPIPKPTMSRPMSRAFLDVAIVSTTAPIVSTIAQAKSMGFRPHR